MNHNPNQRSSHQGPERNPSVRDLFRIRIDDIEPSKTIRETIELWLELWEFDGLYNSDCGCCIGDLMPDCEGIENCRCGYKHIVEREGEFKDYDIGDWYISPRPEKKKGRKLP